MKFYLRNLLAETHKFRLPHVVGYIQALGELYGNQGVLNKVAVLGEYDQTLAVFWLDPPTDGEKAMFEQAWTSPIGDGGINVEHKKTSSNICPHLSSEKTYRPGSKCEACFSAEWLITPKLADAPFRTRLGDPDAA